MESKAVLLNVDETYEFVDLPAESPARLHTMRDLLQCSAIDCVRLTSRIDMWIDDEGLYNHPVNPLATAIAVLYGYAWQLYHGPALLAGFNPDTGDTIPLDHGQLLAIAHHISDVDRVRDDDQ